MKDYWLMVSKGGVGKDWVENVALVAGCCMLGGGLVLIVVVLVSAFA